MAVIVEIAAGDLGAIIADAFKALALGRGVDDIFGGIRVVLAQLGTLIACDIDVPVFLVLQNVAVGIERAGNCAGLLHAAIVVDFGGLGVE